MGCPLPLLCGLEAQVVHVWSLGLLSEHCCGMGKGGQSPNTQASQGSGCSRGCIVPLHFWFSLRKFYSKQIPYSMGLLKVCIWALAI